MPTGASNERIVTGTAIQEHNPVERRGEVRVFDLVGGPLADFLPFGPGYVGGVTVAAGNFDATRTGDEIITGSQIGTTVVKVFGNNGTNRVQLANARAFGAGVLGVHLAAGDLDGDGLVEVLVGAGNRSVVRMFRGGDARPVGSFRAFAQSIGGVRVGVLDQDGDGRVDTILTASGVGQRTQVRQVDSVTLGVIDAFFAFEPTFTMGVFVAG